MAGTRLQRIDRLVRELSFQDNPDRLVRLFGRDDDVLWRRDGLLVVSGRDLEPPAYRINQSWLWPDAVRPWTETQDRPVYDRGLLGDLLHAGRPVLLDRLEVAADDPARAHLDGMASLIAAPGYDRGRPV